MKTRILHFAASLALTITADIVRFPGQGRQR